MITKGEYAAAREQKAAADPTVFHMIARHELRATRRMVRGKQRRDGAEKREEEPNSMLHFLPYEVDLHMFRQTATEILLQISSITRARCTEAAQQQRKNDACKAASAAKGPQ